MFLVSNTSNTSSKNGSKEKGRKVALHCSFCDRPKSENLLPSLFSFFWYKSPDISEWTKNLTRQNCSTFSPNDWLNTFWHEEEEVKSLRRALLSGFCRSIFSDKLPLCHKSRAKKCSDKQIMVFWWTTKRGASVNYQIMLLYHNQKTLRWYISLVPLNVSMNLLKNIVKARWKVDLRGANKIAGNLDFWSITFALLVMVESNSFQN